MKKILLAFILSLSLFSKSSFAMDTEKAGDILLVLIPSAALGSPFYLDDSQGQMQFYKSFGTNLALTYALKYGVDKKRPNGEDHSFPSGHTSISFQSAAFIHKRYGLKYALPAYLAAGFVGYSRVDSKKHYTSDVAAGAVLGMLSSFFFTTKYKGFDIQAQALTSGTYGIILSRSW